MYELKKIKNDGVDTDRLDCQYIWTRSSDSDLYLKKH